MQIRNHKFIVLRYNFFFFFFLNSLVGYEAKHARVFVPPRRYDMKSGIGGRM